MNSTLIDKTLKKNFFSKRKKEKEKLDFGITSTYIALLSLITMLLLYYVLIINTNATKGYTLIDLEKEKRNLLMEKEVLDVKIAELDSSSIIRQDEDLLNMQTIENPKYLVIKDDVQYVYNN